MTDAGQVIYKAEKDHCRAFPEADGDGLRPGPKRNFQVLDPLDFLAEFTQHIPPKGSHLIRYYGWYSNKARGMRRKADASVRTSKPLGSARGCIIVPTKRSTHRRLTDAQNAGHLYLQPFPVLPAAFLQHIMYEPVDLFPAILVR